MRFDRERLMRLTVALATTATAFAFSQRGGRPQIRRSLSTALRSTTATASPYSPLASFMAERPKTRSQGDVPDDVFPQAQDRASRWRRSRAPHLCAGGTCYTPTFGSTHVKAFDAYLPSRL